MVGEGFSKRTQIPAAAWQPQMSEILAVEKAASSRVSGDFTLIRDRQHGITGSRTRDFTTPEQRSSLLRHELPHANMLNASTSSCVQLYVELQACWRAGPCGSVGKSVALAW